MSLNRAVDINNHGIKEPKNPKIRQDYKAKMFATQKIVAGIGNLRAKQTTKLVDPATSRKDDGGEGFRQQAVLNPC